MSFTIPQLEAIRDRANSKLTFYVQRGPATASEWHTASHDRVVNYFRGIAYEAQLCIDCPENAEADESFEYLAQACRDDSDLNDAYVKAAPVIERRAAA